MPMRRILFSFVDTDSMLQAIAGLCLKRATALEHDPAHLTNPSAHTGMQVPSSGGLQVPGLVTKRMSPGF